MHNVIGIIRKESKPDADKGRDFHENSTPKKFMF